MIAAALLLFTVWRERQFDKERIAFSSEREVWVRERRDLNNRIQVPEAAPYLAEQDEEAAQNDLPLLPEFTINQAELEEAQRALAEVGYEDGPAT